MLEKKDIKQFKKLWHNHFNESISDKEAKKRANQLIGLCQSLFSNKTKIMDEVTD